MLSSRIEIGSAQAAAAFADPLQRHLILSFVNQARSISEVAKASGTSLSLTHYHVRRLARLGILRVASIERRAGRPIRRYTACAAAYFIPDAVMRSGWGAALTRELDDALEREGNGESGWLAYVDRHGAMRMRREPAAPARRPQLDAWKILDLDKVAAAELARELDVVLQRFERRQSAGKASRRFLIRCAMAQRTGDRLFSSGPSSAGVQD
jgi:hypothetical protein